MRDIEYMQRAIEWAKKGCGFVNPNPMVGAVIVKDDQIIGQGWHESYGQLHAERNALSRCQQSPQGATLYVTLEPCCHYGKTTPCTEAIIKSGIKRVVIGSRDPNPLVGGKGIEVLRHHHIEVVENVLKKECDGLNEVFFHYIKTGLPLVVMKYAMTMDGKIATHTGESKWITGEIARQKVQEDRRRFSAIMVGIGTVIADDPLLTCRLENSKNPLRIICDTHMRTPLISQIILTAKDVPTLIATCCEDTQKQKLYRDAGCQIILTPKKQNHIDLKFLMEVLGKQKVDSILLEGGGTLNWSALDSRIVNKVHTYIAPKLFGGSNSKTPVEGPGVESPSDSFFLNTCQMTKLGQDILIESEVLYNVHGNC
ncbi:MAG TPA: bifunctional diaminohydroxyphosphoribosylaminopyrimidine deaminase/5-amino-6-(5-phosphoribosylamino)uracil reductase RibD [Epulopiscium sp.]|nr:bifunctional diaminohydroxyphosphoribosylaminopyrimidine deaminase/5-amino-6-(5-phosphoribosylamino)uracil reductase RibD [Candidatus Epulonipiscium sp.]